MIGARGVLCECMSWNSLLVFLGRKIVSDCFHMHLWNHHLYLNPRNVTQSILPPGWNKDRSSFLFSFRHRCSGDIPNNSPKTDAQSSLVRSLAISFFIPIWQCSRCCRYSRCCHYDNKIRRHVKASNSNNSNK